MLAGIIAQHGVDAMHPVFDERIAGGNAAFELAPVTAKEIIDGLPIGAGGRGLAPVAGCVAVNLDLRRKV